MLIMCNKKMYATFSHFEEIFLYIALQLEQILCFGVF